MPVARLHQPCGDVVERAGRAVARPAERDEHADHQVERLERLRRWCLAGLQRRWRRGGIDGRRAAALGKEFEEAGLVLTEPASVVMTHDLAAPCLRCRAEQARCAFLGDQADLDGTGDDRPRVVGAPDRTVRMASKAAYAESSGSQWWVRASDRYLRIVNCMSRSASGSCRHPQ